MSEPLHLTSVAPVLTVNDVETSLAWYRDVLGFELKNEMKHDGRLMGAELLAGSVTLLLTQDDFAKGRDRAKGQGLRLYYSTDQDVDQLAAAIRERGSELSHEPTDQPWGARDFGLVDPDGFNISISTGVES